MMEPCILQDSITMAQNVSSRAWLSLTHPELRWLSESSDAIGEEVKYSQSQIRSYSRMKPTRFSKKETTDGLLQVIQMRKKI